MSKDNETPNTEQPMGFSYKFKRLYDLGSDRVCIIDSMLTNGDSPATVAERIKTEWNQCPSVKTSTLEKQILRYKQSVLEPKLAVAAQDAAATGTSIIKGMKKFRDTVDVMEKLNESINMQWDRIQKGYRQEHAKGQDGKLDGNLSKELRPFTDMCRVLAGLQLETGVVRRVPKQVQGFFQQLDSTELQEFRLEMTQNDATLKSLGVIKDVLQDAASEIIDGKYVPIASEPAEVPAVDVKDVEPESQ